MWRASSLHPASAPFPLAVKLIAALCALAGGTRAGGGNNRPRWHSIRRVVTVPTPDQYTMIEFNERKETIFAQIIGVGASSFLKKRASLKLRKVLRATSIMAGLHHEDHAQDHAPHPPLARHRLPVDTVHQAKPIGA